MTNANADGLWAGICDLFYFFCILSVCQGQPSREVSEFIDKKIFIIIIFFYFFLSV